MLLFFSLTHHHIAAVTSRTNQQEKCHISLIGFLQPLPLTRALKGFFLQFKPAFWWTSINRYHGFSRVGLEKILSPFLEHLEENVGVSAVLQYNILLQVLTPLHVKITRTKNLLSVFRRKLKLSKYLHTVSYNHISFSQSLATRLSSCLFWFLFDNMKNDK